MNCNNNINNTYQHISNNFISKLKVKELQLLLKNNVEDTIYYYVIHSVKFKKDKKIFIQTGCGPNLEGNMITLCTCKHTMRTYPEVKKNVWIAGITSNTLFKSKKRYLFYLFKIKETFNSHFDYYNYIKEHSPKIVNTKSTRKNKFGDLFIPNIKKEFNGEDFFNPIFYKPPIKTHLHNKRDKEGNLNYFNDIEKIRINSWGKEYFKVAKILIGEEKNSFVWNFPIIEFNEFMTQGQPKDVISNFLSYLTNGE